MKTIYFIVIAIIAILYVINNVKKKSFSIEESFFWVVGSIVALFFAIFPKSFNGLANLMGISYAPSLFFLLCVIFLVFINFRNSRKIATQQEKIIELAQRYALLKSKTDNTKK